MYNKNYLSKRPFMVITCKFKPGHGANTQYAGWQDTAGWQVGEELAIVDRVTAKHNQYATLVVDILEAKTVINRFPGESRDSAMAHYLNKYKNEVKNVVGNWMEVEARKLATTRSLDDKLATFDQEQHGGEAMAFTPVGEEVIK